MPHTYCDDFTFMCSSGSGVWLNHKGNTFIPLWAKLTDVPPNDASRIEICVLVISFFFVAFRPNNWLHYVILSK